jgi:hypothetical protein
MGRLTYSTAWHYGCPFITHCHLAEPNPIEIGAALLRGDWLDSRPLEGQNTVFPSSFLKKDFKIKIT